MLTRNASGFSEKIQRGIPGETPSGTIELKYISRISKGALKEIPADIFPTQFLEKFMKEYMEEIVQQYLYELLK